MRKRAGFAIGRTALALFCALLLVSGCSAETKARLYAGDDRDSWQQPERVIEELGIASGQSVADLGSGGGYFTFRLGEAVGDAGRVYAVDVDVEMNERLERLVSEKGATNVATVHADYDDPKIPEPVDLIFTSNTYHHIDDRVAYFQRAARYLKPGGRLAVLEYRREGFFHRVLGHATEDHVIQSELELAGYTLSATHDFIEYQHFLVFDRPD
jgi:ubiquinone/menaquinone biosynthesis C-methylase UbiE